MKTANPLRSIVVIKEGQDNKDFRMALAAWTNSHLLHVTIVTVVTMAQHYYYVSLRHFQNYRYAYAMHVFVPSVYQKNKIKKYK